MTRGILAVSYHIRTSSNSIAIDLLVEVLKSSNNTSLQMLKFNITEIGNIFECYH